MIIVYMYLLSTYSTAEQIFFLTSTLSVHVDFEVPSDTKAAILFLKSIVPLNKFEGKIPAIILKHQIYCVVKDKTLVDRQLVSFTIYKYVMIFSHLCNIFMPTLQIKIKCKKKYKDKIEQ